MDDDPAPGYDRGGVALHLPALEGAVIHVLVQGLVGERHLFVGVEDHQVGVAAHGDGALARVEAEELGRGGGAHLDEAVEGEPPLSHPLAEEEGDARLYPRRAVGYLGEIVPSPLLLLGEGPGAVVGGHGLQAPLGQGPPEVLPVSPVPQGRGEDELGPLEAGSVVVVLGEEEVVGGDLGENALSPLPRPLYGQQRLPAGDVNDVDGAIHQPGQGQDAIRRLGLHQGRAAAGMVAGGGLALGQELGFQVLDGLVVLGVDQGQDAAFFGRCQEAQHLAVVHHEGGVGGVELEAGVAGLGQLRQLGQGFRRGVGGRQV